MPLYEYKCNACGTIFEEIKTIEDRDAPVRWLCPICETDGSVNRIVGTASPAIWKCSKPTS